MNHAHRPLTLLFDAYPPHQPETPAAGKLHGGLALLRDGLSFGLPAGLLTGSLFENLWLSGIGANQAAAAATLPAYYAYWTLFGLLCGMALFACARPKSTVAPEALAVARRPVIVPEPIRPRQTAPLRYREVRIKEHSAA